MSNPGRDRQGGGDHGFDLSAEEFVLIGLLLFLVVVGVEVLVQDIPFIRAGLGFAVFAVGPGALLLTLAGFGPRRELRWLLYAVGVSLLSIMAVGLTMNLVLPSLGVARPIAAIPLGIAHSGLLVILSLGVRYFRPDGRSLSVPNLEQLSSWFHAAPLALLMLPLLAILSVTVLNRTGDNRPLLVLLVVISFIPFLMALGVIRERWHPLAIWTVAMALLYHKTFWKFYHFNGQGNIIAAWKFGQWSIGERAVAGAATTPLLTNVTLSPTFAHLAGIHIFTQIEVLNPLLVSLLPLASFVVFRRYIGSRGAVLGAVVVAFVHPFYFQLPAGGRAAMPVLFLALFGAVMTDQQLATPLRKGLALSFGAGLIVSHYGASYFVMGAIAVAMVLLVLLESIDDGLRTVVARRRPDVRGSARTPGLTSGLRSSRIPVLTTAFAGFYAVGSVAWYLFTFEGRKFELLPEHVHRFLVDFLTGTPQTGGTALRLGKSYGSQSIFYSKIIYVTLAGLIGVGLSAIYLRRFLQDGGEPQRDFDELLALSTGLLGMFSLSFLLAGSWGGGRPMILTLSLTAIFVIFGAYVLVSRGLGFMTRLLPSGPDREWSIQGPSTVTYTLVATLLGVMLVLNTGVLAATVVGGFAPSNVPLQHDVKTTDVPSIRHVDQFEENLAVPLWLQEHAGRSATVYVDRFAFHLIVDWYSPEVISRTDESQQALILRRTLLDLPVGADGYGVLLGHNTELNVAVTRTQTIVSARPRLARLRQTSLIFSSGAGQVYYLNGTATTGT